MQAIVLFKSLIIQYQEYTIARRNIDLIDLESYT